MNVQLAHDPFEKGVLSRLGEIEGTDELVKFRRKEGDDILADVASVTDDGTEVIVTGTVYRDSSTPTKQKYTATINRETRDNWINLT